MLKQVHIQDLPWIVRKGVKSEKLSPEFFGQQGSFKYVCVHKTKQEPKDTGTYIFPDWSARSSWIIRSWRSV